MGTEWPKVLIIHQGLEKVLKRCPFQIIEAISDNRMVDGVPVHQLFLKVVNKNLITKRVVFNGVFGGGIQKGDLIEALIPAYFVSERYIHGPKKNQRMLYSRELREEETVYEILNMGKNVSARSLEYPMMIEHITSSVIG